MVRILSQFALALTLVTALVGRAPADELDDQYLKILTAVDQAEALEKEGKADSAKAKYQAIQKALLALKKVDPTWKPNMVAHRLADVQAKLDAMSPKVDAEASTPSAPAGTSASQANSPASRPAAAPAASVGDKADAGVFSVKLIESGREPRRALRLAPKAGDRQQLVMTLQVGMEMAMAGTAMPKMDMPVMKWPMDLTVDGVANNGDITYTMTMGEIELVGDGGGVPGMADAMRATLGAAKGTSSKAVISSRGVTKSSDANSPASGNPQLRQSMDQLKDAFSGMSAQFPEEPIGVGAKWEVRQVLKSQGMTIKQTGAYEITALDGDRAEVKVTVLQAAANQKIASPAMPGLKIDLEKMEGSGNGKTVYDLSRLIPVTSAIESNADMKMGMDMGGQKQSMAMKTTSTVKLDSK